jgi:hypothetical protein
MTRRKQWSRGRTERYVSLRYWLLESPAWRRLPCAARALYIELAKRYNGRNNGRISYSVREGAEALKVTKDTAGRMLKVLQERGFIVRTKQGAFSLKVSREASEWRLTEYPDDVIPQHASKDFMRWQPPEPDPLRPAKFKIRSFSSDRTVRLQGLHGPMKGTVKAKNDPHGLSNRTAKVTNRAATARSERHLVQRCVRRKGLDETDDARSRRRNRSSRSPSGGGRPRLICSTCDKHFYRRLGL